MRRACSRRSLSFAALLAALLMAPAARADVHVVDPGADPGASLLQSAIDTAAPGAIILVKPGDYLTGHPLPFTITGRSLSLVADAGGARVDLPGIRVSDTNASQVVILRGLHLTRTPSNNDIVAALAVVSCEGLVWADDCELEGPDATPTGSLKKAAYGLHTDQSSRVLVTHSTLTGGDGRDAVPALGLNSSTGATSCMLVGSFVSMLDCDLTGGQGGDGPEIVVDQDGQGGAGALLITTDCIFSGCHITGGAEGAGTSAATEPGPGIAHVFVAHAWLRDTLVEPGAEQVAGDPGVAITLPPGNVFGFAAPARVAFVTSPLREGQPGTLTLNGVQNDSFWLLVSLQAAFTPVFDKQGIFALSPPFSVAFVGTIPAASGQRVLPFTMPHLPTVLDGAVIELQALHFGEGGPNLGSPTTLTWIDASL